MQVTDTAVMKRLFFAILLLALPMAAQQTAITNVRLFDGTKVVPHATVVIDGTRIAAAGANVLVPKGAKVIDGNGKTLLPGLIDSHTHVFPGSLERALRFGVTTEMDMFTSLRTLDPLRAEQAKGPVMNRADIYSAGTLVTVAGGHGSEYFPIPTFKTGDDPQAFVDARIAEGSDYIKLIVETGEAYGMKLPTLSKSDLTALIAAAHKRGKMAVVHISTLAGARDAIDAGADALVHIFADKVPDAGFGAFVAAHHAFVVPTLTVNESTTGVGSGTSLTTDAHLAPYLSADEMTSLKTSFPKAMGLSLANANAAVQQLKKAGVPILAGTDSPNPGTAHGASMHRELELLVKSGLTPIEALTSATSLPAKQFKLNDRGRIAAGLRADLLLVDGDPTTDILATRNIAGIWKNGAMLDRKPEPKRAAEAPAAAAVVPAIGDGMISNFDSGDTKPAFGTGWQVSTDVVAGGVSTGSMDVVAGGANGTPKALHIHADTKPGFMFPWSGAMLILGPTAMQPVDLSSKGGLSFFAKGDTDIRVMLFAASSGRIPRITTVHAGVDWTAITVPWSAFSLDGKDVQAVLFCGPDKGAVDFAIDEVRLK
jgi:imidazolonepropionase-like amidohydrolase